MNPSGGRFGSASDFRVEWAHIRRRELASASDASSRLVYCPSGLVAESPLLLILKHLLDEVGKVVQVHAANAIKLRAIA